MDLLHERDLEIKNIRAQQTKQTVIKKSFANLLFVSIAEQLAYFFNPFIDSAIVGIFLDSSISLLWIIIVGVISRSRRFSVQKVIRRLFCKITLPATR